MGSEQLIILAYFVVTCVPVATVAAFLRLDADESKRRVLPTADSYYLPDEGVAWTEAEREARGAAGRDGDL